MTHVAWAIPNGSATVEKIGTDTFNDTAQNIADNSSGVYEIGESNGQMFISRQRTVSDPDVIIAVVNSEDVPNVDFTPPTPPF